MLRGTWYGNVFDFSILLLMASIAVGSIFHLILSFIKTNTDLGFQNL